MSQTHVNFTIEGVPVSVCCSDRLSATVPPTKRDEVVTVDDSASPPAHKKSKQVRGNVYGPMDNPMESALTSQVQTEDALKGLVESQSSEVDGCDQTKMTLYTSNNDSTPKETNFEFMANQFDSFAAKTPTEKGLLDMEETLEHLNILLRQESEAYPRCPNYLTKASASSVAAKDRVSEAWRRKLCEWCFEVVDHFSYDREVVSFALSYLDRTAAVKSETSYQGDAMPKQDYQLLAVTSLYMAIKIHGEMDVKEGPRRRLRVSAFSELSRGLFSVDVIEATERDILEALHWRVNPPTCLGFLTSLFSLCPEDTADEEQLACASGIRGIYDFARYLTELSECISFFAFTYETSIIAYASMLCAVEALQTSLPLSDSVRGVFLDNMSVAVGICPSDSKVQQICSNLKELCPSIFKTEPRRTDSLEALTVETGPLESGPTESGKVSPVSVVDAPSRQGDNQWFNQNRNDLS